MKEGVEIVTAVVDPDTYRGIFNETFATLRSFGIEADGRIRGVVVTAYQKFLTGMGVAQPVEADLEEAASDAADAAVAAVPIVSGVGAAQPAPAAAESEGAGAMAEEDAEAASAASSAVPSAASSQDEAASAASPPFTDVSPDSSQPPPGSQDTEPDSPGNYGGRRCRSCGNVFGKTRRAARGKKSKKAGKTAKKGGKKAVRKGSFRKGRKHSKKQRR
jgi:hypothetical protein